MNVWLWRSSSDVLAARSQLLDGWWRVRSASCYHGIRYEHSVYWVCICSCSVCGVYAVYQFGRVCVCVARVWVFLCAESAVRRRPAPPVEFRAPRGYRAVAAKSPLRDPNNFVHWKLFKAIFVCYRSLRTVIVSNYVRRGTVGCVSD